MNGAESLIQTVLDAGVEVCFTNPGTSEMHLVAAMDTVPKMRPVLALFEGVCTGAADGYARMTDRPAMTLLHLGPGLGNGIANLHNARRARSPMLNLIGEHATYHVKYDAPLCSDIVSLANPVSGWVRTAESSEGLASDGAEAVAAAMDPPGRIATLIVPSDCSWGDASGPAAPRTLKPHGAVDGAVVDKIAELLRGGEPAALLLGDRGVREAGLRAAQRVAAASGCKVTCETFVKRLDRGAGLPPVERLPYFPEAVLETYKRVKHLILAGAKKPVSFFAYTDYPSELVPEGCTVHTLATPDQDVIGALDAVADALGAAPDAGERTQASRPDKPTGKLDPRAVGAAIGALLPENAIVSDEGLTSGAPTYFLTQGCPPHAVLQLTGGSIGQGLPVAVGAAVACPDRKVLMLHGDGGSMYTIQALWTQAREGLDIVNVIFANRKYQILQVELARMGVAERGPKAESVTDLSHPDLDFAKLAEGMGVPACRTDSAEEFTKELEKGFNEPGPCLIEARV